MNENGDRLVEAIQEPRHHGPEDQEQKRQTKTDIGRHGDEENLDLGHQLGKNPDADIENEAEYYKWCGELDAENESARHRLDRKLQKITNRKNVARPEKHIAVAHRRDQKMMQVGHENERSEEHKSELQSLMRTSDAVCCLKKKKTQQQNIITH